MWVSDHDRVSGLFLRNPFLLFTSAIYAVRQVVENCESRLGTSTRGRDPQSKTVVHRVSEVLLAAKVAFLRLHRGMTEQELNLLKLAAT
jgi:hypothetical protein